MFLVNGVMAVVPTPLTENEDCDYESVEKLINFLAEQNVGMFALGSAGEGMNLPLNVRVDVARRMAEVNDGRVPLLIGGGTFSVREALSFVDQVADCKIDGIHVIPYDNKISGNAIEGLYTSLADKSSIPIWLYQNITRTRGIPVDVVSRLREHPNIKGCKVAGFDLRLNQNFLALETDDFQVIGSADSQFFTFLTLGASASTTSSASCFPELFKDLFNKIRSGDLNAARDFNQKVMKLLKLIPKTAYADNGESSAEMKYMTFKRGFCQLHCARPFRPLNQEERAKADYAFEIYQGYLDTGELDLPN